MSLTSLLVNADAKPLKIICHEFAPCSFQDSNNQLTDILVEIARLACKSWEQGCEIELFPNKRAKKAFHNGHFVAGIKSLPPPYGSQFQCLRLNTDFTLSSKVISVK
ncbi:protein of unknown function [Shewanella benthica]|uniref:Uncharacterized protein n=1 Tax=Shewanella benthica TaxID=43661 RepID=A0A330LX32_9GAMM|nr:protein of unknown function [Shewanella benthica]